MNEHRIPVIEERARVEKRIVERGVVKIDATIKEHVETISEALTHEEVEIRHVPMDLEVDVVPEVRQEGDVVIIPVVEERIVVSKRLVLTEELHVHRRKVSEHASIPVTLRSTDIAVQRESSSEDGETSNVSKDGESL
jgi:uncharacterized protein (TIGR02271 family)